MPIWRAPSVSAQPTVRVLNWSIHEINGKTRHIVGFEPDTPWGRVSSAIESIDLAARRVRTRSGRLYELVGKPGFNVDAQYIWNRWSRVKSVASSRDITPELFEEYEGESF